MGTFQFSLQYNFDQPLLLLIKKKLTQYPQFHLTVLFSILFPFQYINEKILHSLQVLEMDLSAHRLCPVEVLYYDSFFF